MPQIYSRRSGHYQSSPIPPGAVYVGRPSKWENMYYIGKDGSRDAVCDLFERHIAEVLNADPSRLAILREELAGKDLVCWCQHPRMRDPKPRCHAETLLRIANDTADHVHVTCRKCGDCHRCQQQMYQRMEDYEQSNRQEGL